MSEVRMTRRRAKAMAAKISELGEGEVVADIRTGDDITLDISQSSGTVSPPQETRTKRKKTETGKTISNSSSDNVITGSEDDTATATASDDQTGNDNESLVIWR